MALIYFFISLEEEENEERCQRIGTVIAVGTNIRYCKGYDDIILIHQGGTFLRDWGSGAGGSWGGGTRGPGRGGCKGLRWWGMMVVVVVFVVLLCGVCCV